MKSLKTLLVSASVLTALTEIVAWVDEHDNTEEKTAQSQSEVSES